jgi:natural product biosynthesis luciferase-like monooxygenase protein
MSETRSGAVRSSSFGCYLMGEQSLLVHCAEALLERKQRVLGVIAADARIRSWAEQQQIPTISPSPLASLADRLGEDFDYFFSITNLRVVPDAVLAKAKRGGINFHDGPLPAYAGLNVTAWALMAGESEHGVTWHEMAAGVDEGRILAQRRFEVGSRDSCFTLNTRAYENAIASFNALADQLAQDALEPREQDLTQRSYFGKHQRPEAAATLLWQRSATKLDALVRALDLGPAENTLGWPKLRVPAADGVSWINVKAAEPAEGEGGEAGEAGTIVAADEQGITVATGEGEIVLRALARRCGGELPLAEAVQAHGLKPGLALPVLGADEAEALSVLDGELAKYEERWVTRLSRLEPLGYDTRDAEAAAAGPEADWRELRAEVSAELVGKLPSLLGDATAGDALLAALGAYLARREGGRERLHLGYRDALLAERLGGAGADVFAPVVPLLVKLAANASGSGALAAMHKELTRTRERGSFALDVFGRMPQLGAGALAAYQASCHAMITRGATLEAATAYGADAALCFAIDDEGQLSLRYDAAKIDHERAEDLLRRLPIFVESLLSAPAEPLAATALLAADERERLLTTLNDTAIEVDPDLCLHEAFSAQAQRTPDAVAVQHEAESLSYAELDARSNQVARHLQGLGVGPDTLVAVHLERGVDLLVSVLGVLKAGGAYVPVDPSYPEARVALMLEDSAATVLVTQRSLVDDLPQHEAQLVCVGADSPEAIAELPAGPLERSASGQNLAYVIYTSGSTGRPKGVMVEHRNAINFLAAMDAPVGLRDGELSERGAKQQAWLAVTSLSFDISVLELFWSLTRGLKVVLHPDRVEASAEEQRFAHADKPLSISLMYFASDEGEGETGADKYKLLLEGAKFADENGFEAVWTPERHFHAFGGLYPNPSVASAALASITKNVQIRAGSCVLPLHSPIRVAEEWSLVDNLSGGRVGISFAAGWQPNDFVIRDPANFERRKELMFEEIETVRKLWRGETLTMTNPMGKEIEVRTLPRPVQKELPVWVTAAGNPQTFEQGARIGAHVLTHLLGQSIEELAEKVALYRKTWRECGHEGEGRVTLMLHTFVSDDEDYVKETVRGPMKSYLKSAVNLIKEAAWTFPTFKQEADASGVTPQQVFEQSDLSKDEMDALLGHAFDRYYKRAGLFGSPETALEILDDVKGVGVDEVACLVDYGVPSKTVLEQLPKIAEVKRKLDSQRVRAQDSSIPAEIARHDISHLQCTPSQLSMLLADAPTKQALGTLSRIMVGGEALPEASARELCEAAPRAKVLNMYGPTETTVWSAVGDVHSDLAATDGVTIGRPIGNTQLYVLDRRQQLVPPGAPGELCIGGRGVVRGYYQREELTAERFVENPYGEGRIYRTGDLVRYLPDGRLSFLGRLDHQVKVRGYRIELGEIEDAIARSAKAAEQVVVVAREDTPGDKRLVAYMTERPGQSVGVGELREALRGELPDYMVPSNFCVLPSFPLTPNAKVDRKALPRPDQVAAVPETAYVEPEDELEAKLATIWAELLALPRIGMEDNFFDIGGHSLLAVQLHRRLEGETPKPLALTDLYRFPTLRQLVEHLRGEGDDAALKRSAERAETRKAQLGRRQRLRQRRLAGRRG